MFLFAPGRSLTDDERRALVNAFYRGEPPLPGVVRVQLAQTGRWSWRIEPEFSLTVEAPSRELESLSLYSGDELVRAATVLEHADRSQAEVRFRGPLLGSERYRLEVRTPAFTREHEFRVHGTFLDPLEELREMLRE